MNAAISIDSPDSPGAWLGFELGAQRYAVPLARVQEVIRFEPPTPVPGGPPDVLGIINVRGSIVTVFDGGRRLGLPPAAGRGDDSERVIIFAFGEEMVGMRVHAMGDVLDLRDADVMPPPPGRASRADDPVESVVPFGEGFIALLDVAAFCRMKSA